jgi:hypothetical protein
MNVFSNVAKTIIKKFSKGIWGIFILQKVSLHTFLFFSFQFSLPFIFLKFLIHGIYPAGGKVIWISTGT